MVAQGVWGLLGEQKVHVCELLLNIIIAEGGYQLGTHHRGGKSEASQGLLFSFSAEVIFLSELGKVEICFS